VVDAVEAGADGAIPGLAITDTVKRVIANDEATIVIETVPRDDLVTVQTPQAFRRELLVAAHAGANDATDDAALVENYGGRVVVVNGELENIKITSAGDLERVVAFVRSGQ
jgi:2-C-methyl-D-erythritol 4-phosphate cytidylyltransferase